MLLHQTSPFQTIMIPPQLEFLLEVFNFELAKLAMDS